MMIFFTFSSTGEQILFYMGCFIIGLLFTFFGTAEIASRIYKRKLATKNFVYISKMHEGHFVSIPFNQKSEIKVLLAIWQTLQDEIFQAASKEGLEKLFKYSENNDLNSFKPYYSNIKPNNLVKIFIKDAFTESFPFKSDINNQIAVVTQITSIFTLKGITPEQSSKFFVHIKDYFVDHTMVMGIIHFDIYQSEE
ncbi:MAG: hypothetical protein WA057_05925 [Candidatus Magasanikiibacteriota bacterium]